MKLFNDADHAIRDASWCAVDQGVPFAVICSPKGFYVSEMSKTGPNDIIAEVIHDVAEAIRFPDSSPEFEGGASRSIEKGARRNEAINKITRGDSL